MGCGSGSHARLNNGFPFRTNKGHYTMMGYFANRIGDPERLDKLDYSGHVIIDAREQDSDMHKFPTTDVEFVRKWFGPEVSRIIKLADLELNWTAPARKVKAIDGTGTYMDGPVDTYLTVSLNDGPYLADDNVQRGIIGRIYGLLGTDNQFDDRSAGVLRTLPAVPLNLIRKPDGSTEMKSSLKLKFSYNQADVLGVDPNRLSVVMWIVENEVGRWCKLPENDHVRAPGSVEVTATILTWYALGIDFQECN